MRKLHRWLRSTQGPLVIALAAVFFLPTLPGETAEQKVPTTPLPAAIPVAEIATRAAELSNLLYTLDTQLAPSPEIEAIEKELAQVSGPIRRELTGTLKIVQEEPPLEVLQRQEELWKRRHLQTSRWLNVLTERAIQLRRTLDQLRDLQNTWIQTREAAQAAKAPVPIRQQIDGAQAALDAAQAPLQAQRVAVLDLQSRVAQEVTRCAAVLVKIKEVQRREVGGILKRTKLSIWNFDQWAPSWTALPAQAREINTGCWTDIHQYLRDPSRGLPLHAGLFLMLGVLLCAGRRQVQRWGEAGEGASSHITVFDRPCAAALMVSLLVASGPASPAPPTVLGLFEILALVPVIRLIQPVVDPRIVRRFYALGVIFALDGFRQTFAGVPLLEQIVLLLEMLAGIMLPGWPRTFRHLQRATARDSGSVWLRALRIGAGLVFFLLAAGLMAGVLGYLRLARLLLSGVLMGGTQALASYAFVRLLSGLVAFALRARPLRLLRMVQHHCGLLEGRMHRWLVWLAVGYWIYRLLDYLGLLDLALSLGAAILQAKLERGSISISLGDVFAFLLTVWVAYLLSTFTRFLLQEDVYPRMGVAPGLSYAISSLLHYVILALGFVVGMGLLGVNLSRVTVLAGAFGVGIGFGLQSVVNNFVSGLILLFERPIHVGDTVEVCDAEGNYFQGKIRRIGIRASTLRTWQGADIIVPNSQLVTDKVTNWTLGDQLRRIDLPVGMSYSASPEEVIKILEAVARSHPQILKDPPPQGLLVGYGEGSIHFELRAWTDQFERWPQIRSELATALYDAAHAAGLSFPPPPDAFAP